jgi:hypothetical protein
MPSTLLKEELTRLEFLAEVPQDLAKVITGMLSFDRRIKPMMAQLLQNPTFTVVRSSSLIKFNSLKPLNFAFQRSLHVGIRKAISDCNRILPHLKETFRTENQGGKRLEERKEK